VTVAPSRSDDVHTAIAAMAIHASAMGTGSAAVTSSQRKKPSQPAFSASTAREVSMVRSAQGPNGGMRMP
jgi:hypothetical protein